MLVELIAAHDPAADGRVSYLGLGVLDADEDHPVVATPVDYRREGKFAETVSRDLHRLDFEADMPAGGGNSPQRGPRHSRAGNVTKRGKWDFNAVPVGHHR